MNRILRKLGVTDIINNTIIKQDFNGKVIGDYELKNINFELCNFNVCNIDLSFTKSKFINVTFNNVIFTNNIIGKCEFNNVVFNGCKFTNLDFIKSELNNVKFIKCEFDSTDYIECNILVNYIKSELKYNKWKCCKINQIDFRSTLLTENIMNDNKICLINFDNIKIINKSLITRILYITNEHDFYSIRNNRITRYVTYARIIEKLPPKKLKKKVIIGVKKYNLSFADYSLIVEDIETGYKYEYLAFSLEYSYLGNGLYIKNSIYKNEKYNYDKNVNDIIEIYVNSDEVENVIYKRN